MFTSLGYNLEDSPDTCHFTATGDKVLAASAVALGPLTNNGGPTQTRALLPGSPAVNAGNPAGCTGPFGTQLITDQRGFKRPSGGRCDIGAFELQLGAARCTIKAKSRTVLLHPRHKKKKLKDRLQLRVVCNESATVRLAGKLTRRRHKHNKSYRLSATKKVTAGNTVTVLLRLPKAALSRKYKDSIKLTLTARNANGVGIAILNVRRLQVRKR